MKRKKIKAERQKCFLCEKHKTITELHHLKEFKDAKDDIESCGEYKSDLIWLCPNCHTYTHEVIYKLYKNMSNRNYVRTADFVHSIGKKNEYKISKIIALIWKNKDY